MAPVRQSRQYVATKPLPCPGNRRRLALGRIGAPGLMVRAHAHPIGPVDQGPFPLGRCPDRGILLLQPSLDRRVVSLIGAAHRFLRREAPPGQIPAHCALRHPHLELALNQLAHGPGRPQDERQFELFGMPVAHQVGNRGGLPPFEPRTLPLRSALSRPECFWTASAKGLQPHPDGLLGDAEDLRRLGLGHARVHRGNGLTSNRFLSTWGKLPGIVFHSSQYIRNHRELLHKLCPD